ncbi:MAG: tyrosine--tRNA ligase [Patescibacteria group bacterium]|jgi:tyrosyl-tRNA synthetase
MKYNELLTRSIDKIYPTKEEFEKVLLTGKKLRIYMGIDPTADYAHLGHSTNYIILKRFHDLGHKIIVLIGDFTAMIGDPSDKGGSARVRLSKEQVKKNVKTFKDQIGKILDFKDKKNPIEFRFNSDWLSKLNFENLIELASNFTVQQMIERDIFEKRIKSNKPLYVHEFFYPLMQGYDSVELKADVEIGGSDQTFNMLAGRTLVKNYLKGEKFVITTTLLTNPVTGEKLMSKSLGTGIGLNESSKNMFGKIMALPDEAIVQCFVDCTYLSMGEINKIEKGLRKGDNPRDAKILLAYEIVKIYHGEKIAKLERDNFDKVFSKKELPDKITEIIAELREWKLVDLLLFLNFVSSKAAAKRLIVQGGVKIDSLKITDADAVITTYSGMIVQAGKLKLVKIK